MSRTSSHSLATVMVGVGTFAAALLALFQWMELLLVRGGGEAVCGLGETVNCAAVWNLPFAEAVQRHLGVPVAGLGLIWALAAFGLWVGYLYGLLKDADSPPVGRLLALRVTAAAGAVACLGFAWVSFSSKVVCLTCLGTYLCVGFIAAWVFGGLPRVEHPGPKWWGGVGTAALAVLIAYGAVWAPVRMTAGKPSAPTALAAQAPGAAKPKLETFIASLSEIERQALSDALAAYRSEPAPSATDFPARHLEGPTNAPLKVVEFTDLQCGHCRVLQKTLADVRRALPEGTLSVEARHFPLEQECNPLIQRTGGNGLSCLGARAQICLEGASDFQVLRDKLFTAQRELTRDSLLDIAASGSVSRATLEKCLGSEETSAKLKQDILYAARYKPQGTPLVIVNGRQAPPAPAFLYVLALTEGDPNAPAFAQLPKPSAARTQ